VLRSETSPAVKPLLTSHWRLGCGQSMHRQPRSIGLKGGHRAGRYTYALGGGRVGQADALVAESCVAPLRQREHST
jgi:hypothetical protein